MKTNRPDSPKTHWPDSDQSARQKHSYEEVQDEMDEAADLSEAKTTDDLQTSNKSGKHSSVEKLAASRPEFGSSPGDQPVDGAFGADPTHLVTGRDAGPDTNQFRCNACGRYFNSAPELMVHEGECRLAKAATAAGRDSLERQDATRHARNDTDS